MLKRRNLRARGQRGFTMIEVMIAVLILLIGVTGILALQMVAMRSTAYSRHATEATMVAEQWLEELRTSDPASLVTGSYTNNVDAQGVVANPPGSGIFDRTTDITWDSTDSVASIVVTVQWSEKGTETHSISMTTRRARE